MQQQIKLLCLILRYFKGIISFTLETGGANADVLGDNAAGKTSLFDGWNWLLFDKDSQNKKDFSIKTLDASGAPFSKLDHEVEGILMINGKVHTLKKVFREKWQKKRGAVTEDFTGHETNYFIDSVPVKKSEYEAFVSQLADEDVFKLLTSPTYFNEKLEWKNRRQILLKVCGDLSDEEVITANKSLAELPALLGNRTIDGHREMIRSKMSSINDELKKIPVRIDEAQRAMPDTDGLNEAEIDIQIAALNETLQTKQEEMTRIQSGGEIMVKQNRIREIEGELLQLKNNLQAGSMDAVNEQRRLVSKLKSEISDQEAEITGLQRKVAASEQFIAEKNDERERLRTRWADVNAEQFEQNHSADNCPACGQQLPEEAIAEAHEKALNQFNLSKSGRLETINKAGKAAKDAVEAAEKEIEKHTAGIETARASLETVKASLQQAVEELSTMENSIVDYTADPKYIKKLQEKAAVEQEMLELRSTVQGSLEKVRLELAGIRSEAEHLQRNKASFDQVRNGNERIAALNKQEKQLAKEHEELSRQLYLTEEFIRQKVAMFETKINSKFKQVRFKLFKTQINGGVEECCETLYGPNLVPYSSGLNKAAQINAGLDIINTLSDYYQTTAPIFIDNAESVTTLQETNSQQIRLIVSAGDRKLRTEVK